jgi:hypothetical protein
VTESRDAAPRLRPTKAIADHDGYDEVVDFVSVVAVGVVEAILAKAS